MTEIRNLSWSDHNTERNYPFTLESSLQDTSESFTIPIDFITSIYLSIPSSLNVVTTNFFVQSLGNFNGGWSIVIGYQPAAGAAIQVATASIARTAYSKFQYYRLTGIGDYIDITGHVQLGDIDNIDTQPGGSFQFNFADARLEPDAVRPNIRQITSLRVQNGADVSDELYGPVVLRAGTNTRLTVLQEIGEDPVIVWDAIDGAGLNEECVCTGDVTELEPIRRINGIPGYNGDFFFTAGTCIDIQSVSGGLQFTNTCADPCCGCSELETITQQLEQFGRAATTLENFLNALNIRVTTLDQLVLGARLGDRSCIECD